MHFFFFYVVLFLCVFLSFLLLEKKKMPRRKCLKRKGKNRRPEVGAKSERAELELEGKLPPFFAFFFSLSFFFLFFCLRRRRYQEKVSEIKGQKWEPKVRGQSGSLKESSLPSLHFFPSLWFFFLCFLFFSSTWKEKDVRRKCLEGQKWEPKARGQKWEGKSRSQKWEGRVGAWRKAPSFLYIFFLLYGFFFLFFYLRRRKCLEKAFEIEG